MTVVKLREHENGELGFQGRDHTGVSFSPTHTIQVFYEPRLKKKFHYTHGAH